MQAAQLSFIWKKSDNNLQLINSTEDTHHWYMVVTETQILRSDALPIINNLIVVEEHVESIVHAKLKGPNQDISCTMSQ